MNVKGTAKLDIVSDYMPIIENGEQKIIDALKNNQVVFVTRANDEIVELEVFNSEKEFIEDYIKKQTENEYELQVFKEAEQAYLLACNIAIADYFTENQDPWLDDVETLEGEKRVNEYMKAKLLTYEEITKDIKLGDFVDGFYDWCDLLFPYVVGENIDFSQDMNHYCEKDELLLEYIQRIQLYVK